MAANRYNLILSSDIMSEIGLDVLASNQTLTWGDAIIPCWNMDSKTTDAFFYDGKQIKRQEKELKK